jgi:hypothetical protein
MLVLHVPQYEESTKWDEKAGWNIGNRKLAGGSTADRSVLHYLCA